MPTRHTTLFLSAFEAAAVSVALFALVFCASPGTAQLLNDLGASPALAPKAALPQWTDQGPHLGLWTGGVTNISAKWDRKVTNHATGALHSVIMLDDTGRNVMVGGTSGIWVTNNAKEPQGKIVWRSVADGLSSKLGAVQIGSLWVDRTNKAVYACLGYRSSFRFTSMQKMGIIRALPPYNSWTLVNTPPSWTVWGACRSVKARGKVILAAIDPLYSAFSNWSPLNQSTGMNIQSLGGIWRSVNGGTSWARLAGPNGLPKQIYAPHCLSCLDDLSSCYAYVNPGYNASTGGTTTLPDNFFFTSTNQGLTWKPIPRSWDWIKPVPANAVRCTVSFVGDDDTEYAAFLITPFDYRFNAAAHTLPKLMFLDKSKGTWESIEPPAKLEGTNILDSHYEGIFPAGTYDIDGAMVFDPFYPNQLYIGGDRVAGPEDKGSDSRRRRRSKLMRRNMKDDLDSRNSSSSKTSASARLIQAKVCDGPNLVGSTRPVLNSYGSVNYAASVWRTDVSWAFFKGAGVPLAGGTALDRYSVGRSAPHPEVRDMVMDPSTGDLIIVTQGGIYRRKDPTDVGLWESMAGTGIGSAECFSVAYDKFTNRFACGVDGAGTWMSAANNPTSEGRKRWYNVLGTRGTVMQQVSTGPVDVDPFKGNKTHGAKWILSYPNFAREYAYIMPDTNQPAPGAKCEFGSSDDIAGKFYQKFTRNRFVGNDFLIVQRLQPFTIWYSNDSMASNFQNVTPPFQPNNWTAGASIEYTYGALFGGRRNGQNFPSIWWAYAFNVLLHNDPNLYAPRAFIAMPGGSRGSIADLAVDPENYRRLCLTRGLGEESRIYCSLSGTFRVPKDEDVGPGVRFDLADWTEITGNMHALALQKGPIQIGSVLNLVWIRSGATEFLIASTGHGIIFSNLAKPTVWRRFTPAAGNLPPVIAMDMKYYAENDMLVLGTIGRGVWSLTGVTRVLRAS